MKLWPLGLYRVAGDSMQPTYRPGDLLLGWRWFRPKADDIVIVRQNNLHFIKRLMHLEGEGYWLEGDNAKASTDSRQWGYLQCDQLEAVIIAKIGQNS